MENCEGVDNTSGMSMVASDNFSKSNLPENSIENIRDRFAMFSETKIDMSEALEEEDTVAEGADGGSANDSSVVLNMGEHSVDPRGRAGKHDTFSMASTSSASSSSSSLSSMGITFESERKLSTSSIDQKTVKLFGPANESQAAGSSRTPSQAHPRIRRVPSTANPKYRVPKLQKNQRSHSQPHIFANSHMSQRRNSSPSQLTGGITHQPTVHAKNMKQTNSMPDFTYSQQKDSHSEQAAPQQIIYLQIPQPSPSQLCDPQSLQQQISSQLQLLVPQIYNQLLNQITVDSAHLESIKTNLNQHKGSSESDLSSKDKLDSNNYLSSSFTTDGNQSQKVKNQVLQQNANAPPHPKRKRQKTSHSHRHSNMHKTPSMESLSDSSTEGSSGNTRSLPITDLTQILQHIKPHHLQQNISKSEPTYLEIQQEPGYPKITIPLTQELLLQCQQLQQLREPVFQPRLETILEESLSVKHLKISRYSKTKIIACVVTILCVIGVILLAGDKTIAVAVVAAIFILFLLASTFYLYTNSSKNNIDSHGDSQRLQVNTIGGCDKPSLV